MSVGEERSDIAVPEFGIVLTLILTHPDTLTRSLRAIDWLKRYGRVA